MSYIKVNQANLIKKVGVNPIYELKGKHYVGLESLFLDGEEVENCIDCDSLEEAEKECEILSSYN